jgi:hypothetical protein
MINIKKGPCIKSLYADLVSGFYLINNPSLIPPFRAKPGLVPNR